MNRANVVSLLPVLLLAGAASAMASGVSPSISPVAQTAPAANAQNQAGQVMNLPLLVYVDGRGQVRSIQHAQRLPTAVNDLLWKNVRTWTTSSALVNGRHEGAQLLMNVTLHAQPQADGNTNVYFTLASEGPVLRGYWKLQGTHVYGHCSPSADTTAGQGGKQRWCSSELIPSDATAVAAAGAK
ncbi:hypothetical protein [Dyella acidiphila]|uniref:Uncharacterized protein n=1 Tax=Dyella acidiphila TaxID=2775866 RepID=A0ABR9G4X1_9GAMM|nr:hypothetical protein [Dyella acidiphila]MBE1159096.1 hypothetical protein [Dyella acidiphila]